MMKRREFIKSTSALAALSAVRPARSADTERLSMPELIDARAGGRFRLQARRAVHQFGSGLSGETMGFSADYLGPVIRVGPGETEAVIDNGIDETITTHWHGLLIPGEVDGGPHQPIPPGKTWRAVLPITQEPATTWYHSHVHGDTGRQVYRGLAGILQISDGRDDERGLPASYGEDDLTLIVQDKRFERGQLVYEPFMPDIMHGFLGNMIMVNGQVGRQAVLPPGIVRLRLLNASNARILQFSLASGRPMHLIATDSGMLPNPLELSSVRLATGERAEILIDLARVQDDTLIAHTVANSPMMGGMMGGRASPAVRGQAITVLPMVVDASRKARQSRLPVDLGGSTPPTDTGDAQRDEFTLEMGMMGGMGRGMMGRGGMGPGMGRGMMGGGMRHGMSDGFAINGRSFDMARIDRHIERGRLQLWRVNTNMMHHPFHVHGVRFAVLSVDGQAPRPEQSGWKDTVLVSGETELLMRFEHAASARFPYMLHCHILEHEDAGMMAQFSVA